MNLFGKRMIALLLCLLLLPLSGCSSSGGTEAAKLRFADSVNFSQIEALNGKTVSIVGYMATISPLDGKFVYLMNLPYQSCPFCVPNTTQLANTMAVYAPEGKSFSYTDQAIRVTGVIEVGAYQDDFGYEYNYRIRDASYETVDLSEVSEEYALWQSIAADGIVAEINAMFDYLYFVCQWTEYEGGYTAEDGTQESFYLYPGDAEGYLADNGPNGFADKRNDQYFPGLIARVQAISDTRLNDLVEILKEARELEQYALSELKAGAYTLDEQADKYVLTHQTELAERFNEVYGRFSAWMTRWEL